METFNPNYFAELLSDSGEFNTRSETKHKLKETFHGWRDKLSTIVSSLADYKKSSYYISLSFTRQLEIAYIHISGEIEKHVTDTYAGNYCRKRNSRKNSLELIELSSINKVSLVQVFSCSNTGSIRDDPYWTSGRTV